MPLILPPPETQFLDQNGRPYADGSIAFYIPGTDTPKDTWQDHDGTALNTNPVVLDSAGRAIIFGNGDYRAVLRDADGNLIYDQWTSGIPDTLQAALDAETAARIAADNAEAAARDAADNAIYTSISNNVAVLEIADNNEATTRANADTSLQAEIDAITGATAAGVRAGSATTDASGYIHVTFSPAFTTALVYFTVIAPGGTLLTTGPQPPTPQAGATIINTTAVSTSAVTARIGQDMGTGPSGYLPYGAGIAIGWFAIGY